MYIQVVEHISLLVEDWFVGVRPRTLVVPCPHCSANVPHERVPIRRSFSSNPDLLPDFEKQPPVSITTLTTPTKHSQQEVSRPHPEEPYRTGLNADAGSSHDDHMTAELDQQPYAYAFRYNDCVVIARNRDTMYCPAHGQLPLQYMAPDTVSSVNNVTTPTLTTPTISCS